MGYIWPIRIKLKFALQYLVYTSNKCQRHSLTVSRMNDEDRQEQSLHWAFFLCIVALLESRSFFSIQLTIKYLNVYINKTSNKRYKCNHIRKHPSIFTATTTFKWQQSGGKVNRSQCWNGQFIVFTYSDLWWTV